MVTLSKPTRNKDRPLSWSQISTFEWNPKDWYAKYVLNLKPHESSEMSFGKKFADSCEARKPLAPVTLYSEVEYPLKVVFNGHPFVGFIDTYDKKTHAFREFKTSKKMWTQQKAQDHGQLQMYALCLYITHRVKPEDLKIHLDCIQTQQNGDFSIDFIKPFNIKTFEVKLKMQDILRFGVRINNIISEMDEFVKKHV